MIRTRYWGQLWIHSSVVPQVWPKLCQTVGASTSRLWRFLISWWSVYKDPWQQHYWWRAVDQDGGAVEVFLQPRRDGAAAKRFFKRLISGHGSEPRKIVTDKLKSYGVVHRELIPESIHDTSQYASNRAELSYPPTCVREWDMRRIQTEQVGAATLLEPSHSGTQCL